MTDTLLYLSLGDGRHVDEIRFSVLTAERARSRGDRWRCVVHTDSPDRFAGLPAEVRPVDPATRETWAGADYVYRAKIAALAAVLSEPGAGRAAIVDGDTWFRRSPAKLFQGVARGRSVMHLREGPPEPDVARALRRILSQGEPVDLNGAPWGLTVGETLWNSGVVGLHVEDAALCAEVLALTDQLLGLGFAEESHVAEMLAFSVVLGRRTTLRECWPVVTHYWLDDLRLPFVGVLKSAFEESGRDGAQALADLWPLRPRLGAVGTTKLLVKPLAARVGVEL